jgi:iron complex transport system substrate-binding protein
MRTLTYTTIAAFALMSGLMLAVGAMPPRGVRKESSATPDGPGRRVVILPNSLAGFSTINEGVTNVAGVSRDAKKWACDGIISRVYPDIDTLPLAGSGPVAEPETLLLLKPDTVIVSFLESEVLRQAGIGKIVENKFESRRPVESRLATWTRMGEAVGREERTHMLCQRFKDDFSDANRSVPSGCRKPRVAFIMMTDGDWSVAGGNYYGAYIIEAAGGINIAAKSNTFDRENIEELFRTDPDILFFTANTSDRNITKRVLEEPAFKALRAVREGRAYQFPEHAYMNEMAENRILLTWTRELFFPDAMPKHLRQIFRETYKDLYNYAVTDAEIDCVIYMDANRNSTGYNRFNADAGAACNL